jgi:hypothetical protein
VNAPSISPTSGVYSLPQAVSMSADPGATIRYTDDGTEPTITSPVFTPFTVVAPKTIRAIAIQSFQGAPYPESTRAIVIDPAATVVPTAGLIRWYRSDAGCLLEAGSPPAVTGWVDLSRNVDATPGTEPPTYLTSQINGLPAVDFQLSSGGFSPRYFEVGGADLTGGLTLFGALVSPSTSANSQPLLSFRRTAGTYTLASNALPSTLSLVINNNGSQTSLSSSAISASKAQFLEWLQGASAGQLFRNGSLLTSGALANPALEYHEGAIGYMVGGSFTGNAWKGQLAELLLFSRQLSGHERAAVEHYLRRRYELLDSVSAPSFSAPSSTTFDQPSQLSIHGPVGSELRFTTDGTTPTTSSPLYSGPLNINYSQTIKAIAVINGVASSAATATYTLDATKYPAPSGSDMTAPRINLQIPTPAQ